MTKSRLQELADQLREGEVSKAAIEKDSKTIRSRLEKLNTDIATLENLRRDAWMEFAQNAAALNSLETQLRSIRQRINQIVMPNILGEHKEGKDVF